MEQLVVGVVGPAKGLLGFAVDFDRVDHGDAERVVRRAEGQHQFLVGLRQTERQTQFDDKGRNADNLKKKTKKTKKKKKKMMKETGTWRLSSLVRGMSNQRWRCRTMATVRPKSST